MDIKNNRRDNLATGKWTDRDLPNVEGQYPADGKKGHGNAASDNNVGWDIRSQSWQRGADSDFNSVEKEKREGDLKFGVPHEDNFPAPSDPAGPPSCGARYQTASYDGDAPLPNPHNWSNNPGFMSASTASMATAGAPRSGGTATIATPGSGRSLRPGRKSGGTGVVGRSGVLSKGNVSLPAPGDVDSRSEGSPQVISTGYGQ